MKFRLPLVGHIAKVLTSPIRLADWSLKKVLPPYRHWPRRLQQTIATILCFAILFPTIAAIAVLNPWTKKAEAVWYDDNWAYRQIIAITNSGTIQTDYQVSFTIDTRSSNSAGLINQGKLQADCDDLRVTDASGKLLPYWIEESTGPCDNTSTKVWTKVPSIPTSGANIYVYYGNPTAANRQNGNQVFELFDDFNSSLDTTKWPTRTGSPTVSGGVLVLDGDGVTYDTIMSNYTATTARTLHIRHQSAVAANVSRFAFTNAINSNFCGGTDYACFQKYLDNRLYSNTALSSTDTQVNQAAYDTSYHYYKIKYTSTSSVTFSQDTTTYTAHSTNIPTSASMKAWIQGVNGTANVDWVFVTKTASTEPSTGTPASEEKAPSPIGYWKLDDGQGTTAKDSTTNQMNGTLANSPTWQGEDQCINGKCLYFGGTDTYVNLGTSTVLNTTSSARTISTWVKVTDSTNNNRRIFSKRETLGGSESVGYELIINPSTCLVTYTHPAVASATATATGCINTWVHIEAVYSGTQGTVYINGRPGTAATIGASGNASTSPALIGTCGSEYNNSTSSCELKGFVDDLKIYNYARSAAQIQADYTARSSNEGAGGVLGSNIQNQPAVLSDGLVVYLPMNETSGTTVTDASGNSNTGTATDGTTGNGDGNTPPPVTTGKFGAARDFDGTDDYITVPNHSSWASNTSITYAAWIKTDQIALSKSIINARDSSNQGFDLDLLGSAGGLRFQSRISGGGTVSTGNVATGSWYHIVGTYDNVSKELRIYMNGVLGSRTSCTTCGASSAMALLVGSYEATAGPPANIFDGAIDEVRVYKRALSEQDVRTLYNWAPGPMAYYKFDEGSGTTAYDSSGNGANGTIVSTYQSALANVSGTATTLSDSGRSWTTNELAGETITIAAGTCSGQSRTISSNTSTTITVSSSWTSCTPSTTSVYYVTNSRLSKVGKFGSALEFEYSNDGVFANTSKVGRRTATLAAWVDFSSSSYYTGSTDVYLPIVRWNWEMSMTVRAGAGAAHFITSTVQGLGQTFYTPSPRLSGWHHLATTHDGTNLRLYVDGVLVNTAAASGTIPDVGRYLEIGYDDEFGTQTDIKIDEVKYYNYPRTQKQVVEDMNASHPAGGSPVGSAIGHWKFDEGNGTTANNSGSQGSTVNGTLVTMASPATSTSGWSQSGKFNRALNFDGTNDTVSIASESTFDFEYNQSFSISSWIKSSASGALPYMIFAKMADGAPYTGYSFYMSATGQLGFQVVNTWNSSAVDVVTSKTINDGSWHHVGVVYAGTGTAAGVYLYIDGKLYANTINVNNTVSASILNNITPYIGSRNNTVYYFNGTIDEVKVYNGALSQEQILVDMNRGASQVMGATSTSASGREANSADSEYCIPGDSTSCASPIARWDFDDKNTTSTIDTSGNSFSATWSGTGTPKFKPGKFGSSANFNGTNDCLAVPSSASFTITSGTYEAWVKTTNAGSSYRGIIAKSSPGGIYLKDNILIAYLGADLTSSINVADGNWHHVALTFQSAVASGVNLYLDGKLVATETRTFANGNDLALGSGANPCSSQYYLGQLDKVMVFNYARTPAQIAWDYNRGGPVGWWKMDECQGTTLNDSSGNSLTGTWNGSSGGTITSVGDCNTNATTAWYGGRTGKWNYSLKLDGNSDYVSVPYNSKFNITGDITLSAWIYRTASNSYEGVIEKSNQTSTWDYSLFIQGSTARFLGSALSPSQLNSTTTLPLNTWIHLVATRSGTTNNIYINGKLDISGTATGSFGSGSNDLYIGSDDTNTTSKLNGQIDDVRVYNYALTPEQIKSVYTNGAINFSPSSGAP
jgi:hypothetical protein